MDEIRKLIRESLEGGEKKKYLITFEDKFDFSISKKEAEFTDSQYQKALEDMKSKRTVVDKPQGSTRLELRIKSIKPI